MTDQTLAAQEPSAGPARRTLAIDERSMRRFEWGLALLSLVAAVLLAAVR